VPKPDVPTGQKASAGDDTGDGGVSSTKPTAPNLISFGVLEQSDPSSAVWVSVVVPPTDGHGRKCSPPATKRNKPIRQAD
jgi:hypothetical protein